MKLIQKLVVLLVLMFGLNAIALADDDIFKKQCDSGDGNGCSILGLMYKHGEGVKQDYLKAVELYQKACDLGIGDACILLASMYGLGEGVKENYQRALKYYRKACDFKYKLGCVLYTELKKKL